MPNKNEQCSEQPLRTIEFGSNLPHKVWKAEEWEKLRSEIENVPNSDFGLLRTIWDTVHAHKYDMDFMGDVGSHEFVFRHVELPLIKKIYPSQRVSELVKKWINHIFTRAKNYNKRKVEEYKDLRKRGMGFREAKRLTGLENGTSKIADIMAERYAQPYIFKYELTSEDADMLYDFGIERFIKLFYDRFYTPVKQKNDRHTRKTI